MKHTIWKYPVLIQAFQTIEMPKGAEILCVQTQVGIAFLWAIVNKEADLIKRTFRVYGTGKEFYNNDDSVTQIYIGTFQINNGALVWHVFEVIEHT